MLSHATKQRRVRRAGGGGGWVKDGTGQPSRLRWNIVSPSHNTRKASSSSSESQIASMSMSSSSFSGVSGFTVSTLSLSTEDEYTTWGQKTHLHDPQRRQPVAADSFSTDQTVSADFCFGYLHVKKSQWFKVRPLPPHSRLPPPPLPRCPRSPPLPPSAIWQRERPWRGSLWQVP